MTPPGVDSLGDLLETAGVGWMLSQDREERLDQVKLEIEAVEREFAVRFPARIRATPLALELATQPIAFQPLIQSFAVPMRAPMRTMVYSVLIGASVRNITYEYEYQRQSNLRVVVEFDTGENSAFESDDLWDAEVLRHFGMMKLGGKPVVDGYYAFRNG